MTLLVHLSFFFFFLDLIGGLQTKFKGAYCFCVDATLVKSIKAIWFRVINSTNRYNLLKATKIHFPFLVILRLIDDKVKSAAFVLAYSFIVNYQ